MPEIYVSTDVETDGPIPGPNSMLSFASAAYLADKTLVSTFSANLDTLPDASGDAETTAFWESEPVAWAACRENPQEPAEALKRYVEWVESLLDDAIEQGALFCNMLQEHLALEKK